MPTIIKKSFFCVLILILINGCVNIKSKYITPTIYTIKQLPANNTIKTKIDKSIFIKQFNIGAELTTNKIVVFDGNNLQYYNYHLWALPIDELLTDYTFNRFNNYNVFEKGVVKSIFTITPDYILESNVNSFKIVNSNTENNVEIVLTAYLYRYSSETKDYQLCFTNKYSKKEESNTLLLDGIIIIIENIVSEITDNILKDIIDVR
jgi:ABC-type uncharacterized transport system auxiliary subunit